jgi:hypothetical protein
MLVTWGEGIRILPRERLQNFYILDDALSQPHDFPWIACSGRRCHVSYLRWCHLANMSSPVTPNMTIQRWSHGEGSIRRWFASPNPGSWLQLSRAEPTFSPATSSTVNKIFLSDCFFKQCILPPLSKQAITLPCGLQVAHAVCTDSWLHNQHLHMQYTVSGTLPSHTSLSTYIILHRSDG